MTRDNLLDAIPELLGRDSLADELLRFDTFRKAFLNTVDIFENIALMPNPAYAPLLITLFEQHTKARFKTHWKSSLGRSAHENHVIWAEFVGCLRNLVKNMLIKSGATDPNTVHFSQYDIKRNYS
jgi:hypothetical protein